MALLDSANNLAELNNIAASRVNLEVYSWSEVYPIGQTYNRAEINAKIASGSGTVRRYFSTKNTDALAWYTLGTITLSDGTYSSLNFSLQVNKGNLFSWGNANKFDSYQFLVKLTRSAAVENDSPSIEIIGPKVGLVRARLYDNKYFEIQISADVVGNATYNYNALYLAGSENDWSTAVWLDPMDKVPGLAAPGTLVSTTTTGTLGIVTHLQGITQNGYAVVGENKLNTYGAGLTGSSTFAGTQNIAFNFPSMPSYTGTSDSDLLPVYNSTTGAYQKITKGDLIPDAAGIRIKGNVLLNTGNTGTITDDPLNTTITAGVAPNTAGSADPAKGYSFFVINSSPVTSLITGTAVQFELSDQVVWTGSAWKRLPAFGGINVRTFKGRSGDVVPVLGDYTAATVNGATSGGATGLTIQQALDYKADINQTESITGNWSFSQLAVFANGIANTNPSNASASANLSWNANIPRIRVGGSGTGSLENFEIQGQSDAVRLSVGATESYIGVSRYKIWHAGSANLSTADWAVKDLYAANNMYLNNSKYVYGKDTVGSPKTLVGMDTANRVVLGNNSNQVILRSSITPLITDGITAYSILHDGNIGAKNYAVKSLDETITGLWTHSSGINMANNKAIQGTANGTKLTINTKYNLIKLDNDDDILVGSDTARMGFFSNDPANLWLVSEIGNPARQYRMYNEGFKPTPAAIGAVNKAGDTMTGRLTFGGTAGSSSAVNPFLYGFETYTGTGGINYGIGLLDPGGTSWGTNIYSANQSNRFIYFSKVNSVTPSSMSHFSVKAKIALDSGEMFLVDGTKQAYHTGFKPTPLEIGAVPTSATKGTAAAAYYLSSASSIGGTKIRLPFLTTAGKMVSFTVRVYQSYTTADIQFSGYLYASTGQWHLPKAIMIAGSSAIAVAMGRDTDGMAYVWLAGGTYRGVAVLDVVGGYNEADWNTGWDISESDVTPSIILSTTVYPPYSPNNKPTAADLGLLASDGKATDSDKLDGRDSTDFVTYGAGSYSQLLGKNNSTSDWLRTTTNGLLPSANGIGSLGTASWQFAQVHGTTIYENGSTLSSKYLGLAGGTLTGALLTTSLRVDYPTEDNNNAILYKAGNYPNTLIIRTSGGDPIVGSMNSSGGWTSYISPRSSGVFEYHYGGVTRSIYHTGYKPSATDVGAAPTVHSHDRLTPYGLTDWNATDIPNGFIQGDTKPNAPTATAGWYWGINMQHSLGYGMQLSAQNGTNNFYLRTRNQSGSGSWGKVYTSLSKPTAEDVGAYTKAEVDASKLSLTGGVVTGALVVKPASNTSGFVLSANSSGYSELVRRNLDGTDQWTTGLRAYGASDWRVGADRIYHAGFKPSTTDVGAVSITGDTMTGGLTVPSILINTAAGVGSRFGGTTHKALVGVSSTANEYLFGGSETGTDSFRSYIRIGTNKLEYTSLGNAPTEIYHQGNKPNAIDVGLSNYKNASSAAHGAIEISGEKGSYSGIYFTNYARTLMINGTVSGVYKADSSTWQWYFTNDTLTSGKVPWARIPDAPVYTSRWPTAAETGALAVDGVATFVGGSGYTSGTMIGQRYTSGGTGIPSNWGANKLDYRMVGAGSSGAGGTKAGHPSAPYSDIIYLNAYGSDVPASNALIFSKSSARIGFRFNSRYDDATWGAFNEIYHSGFSNIGLGSTNYASGDHTHTSTQAGLGNLSVQALGELKITSNYGGTEIGMKNTTYSHYGTDGTTGHYFYKSVTAQSGFVGSLTGNASTASTLQTARSINGVSFNGSQDITVADSTKLPLTGGALTGALAANAGISQDGHVILNGTDTWLRTVGATGWFSTTYGGGLSMSDTTWIRTYGSKKFYVDNTSTDAIYTTGGITTVGNINAGAIVNANTTGGAWGHGNSSGFTVANASSTGSAYNLVGVPGGARIQALGGAGGAVRIYPSNGSTQFTDISNSGIQTSSISASGRITTSNGFSGNGDGLTNIPYSAIANQWVTFAKYTPTACTNLVALPAAVLNHLNAGGTVAFRLFQNQSNTDTGNRLSREFFVDGTDGWQGGHKNVEQNWDWPNVSYTRLYTSAFGEVARRNNIWSQYNNIARVDYQLM